LKKNKKKLNERIALVQNWLQGVGIKSERLWLEKIVPLLFEVYNPLSIKKQSETLFHTFNM
jgi:hypothetical protein